MISKKVWIPLLLVVLAGAGYFFRADILSLVGRQSGTAPTTRAPSDGGNVASLTTTPIRPASDIAQVSAAGNIQLTSQRSVMLQASGIISEVLVQVGDTLSAGDTMVVLDTTDLEIAVTQAQLQVDSAQNQLDKLREPADPSAVASAQFSLASARQNLVKVQAGPTQAQLAAAEAALAAAQARYQELKTAPVRPSSTQIRANLEKVTITLQQAQWAYDKVAYKGDVGASSQAAALQTATIDFDTAKAAYEIAIAPATESGLQDARGAIQSAQDQLDTLRSQPAEADVASAQAQVASAQSQLDSLLKGASRAELRAAEISIEQAQIALVGAQTTLDRSQLRAPVAGTVLSVGVAVGQEASDGLSAVTLADLSALELTVNVAEVDVGKVTVGQGARISVDALPGRVLSGVVARVAPSSTAGTSVVNYPVTVRLTDPDLAGVRPGMTAVADLMSGDMASSWLVPTSSVVERDGQSQVMILRDGQPVPITVTPQRVQGEWTIVQSADLREGDQALGSVSSRIDQQNNTRGGFGPPGGGIPGMGGPPPPGGGGGGHID